MNKTYGINYYDDVHTNIDQVADYWGDQMPTMCMEELAELIQAISKKQRYSAGSFDNLREEIADVYISLYALMMYYDIEDVEITPLINKKLRKGYGNKEKLKDFLFNNDIGIRAYNSLLRNKIDSVEKLVYTVKNHGRNWYKDIKGLGQKNAEHIEGVILMHSDVFITSVLVSQK